MQNKQETQTHKNIRGAQYYADCLDGKAETTPIQRLREFVRWAKEEGLCKSEPDFERQCGLSPKYIANNSCNGKGNLGTEMLGRIVREYPMLNLAWLCTGEGAMFDGGARMDYYRAFREKCRELEVMRRKLEAIRELVGKE